MPNLVRRIRACAGRPERRKVEPAERRRTLAGRNPFGAPSGAKSASGFATMMEDTLRRLFDEVGGRCYAGEAVTQRAHALQCASLAQDDGAPPALIAAALLHDVGHMIDDDDARSAARGVDARHEVGGARYLAAWFGPATIEPVRLHVQAKAFLCRAEAGYHDGLSPVSRRSLELQGGIMSAGQAAVFQALPFAREAVRLRRWDDLAKVPGRTTPPLEHFLRLCRDALA
jgi:[1-hydroxy-2-(trimethylamino)ethyl]phosphonate dioxygenase